MKEEAKSQLKKIVGDYDEKLAEAERVDAARRAAHAAFPGRFVTLKKETIQPAIQEIADMLNERGHEASVREQEESSSAAGGVKSAAVWLRIVPKPFAHKSTETNPITIEITFSANRSERKVTVASTNTMIGHSGTVGKCGEYEIDAVTADVVAAQVIQTLNEAFGRTR
jgi:vancomycin resistance protein YoaR